jgi:alpha-tubulin suppressor-like RCC1 family protein
LGQPKREVESDLFGRKSLKRTQQCEIRPRIIQSLTQITDVSAGANHCLAVTSQGKLIAWGSNNYGQCGVTDLDQSTLQTMHRRGNQDRYDGMKEKKSTSLWDDIWLPREIPVVGAVDDIFFMSVSSGGIHSAAIDKNGVLYTWGGGGESNCLGHGDQVQYEYGNDNRIDSRRRQVLAMSGRLEVPVWSSPRAVESLIEENISLVSLGERNGAAVTETGNMYVWGYDSIALQKVRQTLTVVGKSHWHRSHEFSGFE